MGLKEATPPVLHGAKHLYLYTVQKFGHFWHAAVDQKTSVI
jgi:hypothetical protein